MTFRSFYIRSFRMVRGTFKSAQVVVSLIISNHNKSLIKVDCTFRVVEFMETNNFLYFIFCTSWIFCCDFSPGTQLFLSEETLGHRARLESGTKLMANRRSDNQIGSALILVGWRAKITPQKVKKLRNFMLWSAWCSILRSEGFSCSLDVLDGGPWINKLQFSIKNFVHDFWSSKPFYAYPFPDPHWNLKLMRIRNVANNLASLHLATVCYVMQAWLQRELQYKTGVLLLFKRNHRKTRDSWLLLPCAQQETEQT